METTGTTTHGSGGSESTCATVNNLQDLPSDVLQRIIGMTLVGRNDRTNASLVCKWMMHQVDKIHKKLLERFMEKHKHRMDGTFLERIHKISREGGTVSTTVLMPNSRILCNALSEPLYTVAMEGMQLDDDGIGIGISPSGDRIVADMEQWERIDDPQRAMSRDAIYVFPRESEDLQHEPQGLQHMLVGDKCVVCDNHIVAAPNHWDGQDWSHVLQPSRVCVVCDNHIVVKPLCLVEPEAFCIQNLSNLQEVEFFHHVKFLDQDEFLHQVEFPPVGGELHEPWIYDCPCTRKSGTEFFFCGVNSTYDEIYVMDLNQKKARVVAQTGFSDVYEPFNSFPSDEGPACPSMHHVANKWVILSPVDGFLKNAFENDNDDQPYPPTYQRTFIVDLTSQRRQVLEGNFYFAGTIGRNHQDLVFVFFFGKDYKFYKTGRDSEPLLIPTTTPAIFGDENFQMIHSFHDSLIVGGTSMECLTHVHNANTSERMWTLRPPADNLSKYRPRFDAIVCESQNEILFPLLPNTRVERGPGYPDILNPAKPDESSGSFVAAYAIFNPYDDLHAVFEANPKYEWKKK